MKSKSPTITSITNRGDRLPPVHPGEVLAQDVIIPYGITAYRVAVDLGVPLPRVNDIVLQKRAMTADMALRLEKYFGVSAEFWMNLQARFDLDEARDRIEAELEAISGFDKKSASEKIVRPRTMQRERDVIERPKKRTRRQS